MRTIKVLLIFMMVVLLSIACDDSVSSSRNISGEWLIPKGEIFHGGPGKDGIPAISNPSLVDNSSINYMKDDDLIIGVKLNGQLRGYPHPILDWHEIINDQIGITILH